MASGRPKWGPQGYDPVPLWWLFCLLPFPGLPSAPSALLSRRSLFLAISNHHIHYTTSCSSLGPEPFTSATQPDFVDAIPFAVYVSAGGVSIESREASFILKDLVPLAGHGDSRKP